MKHSFTLCCLITLQISAVVVEDVSIKSKNDIANFDLQLPELRPKRMLSPRNYVICEFYEQRLIISKTEQNLILDTEVLIHKFLTRIGSKPSIKDILYAVDICNARLFLIGQNAFHIGTGTLVAFISCLLFNTIEKLGNNHDHQQFIKQATVLHLFFKTLRILKYDFYAFGAIIELLLFGTIKESAEPATRSFYKDNFIKLAHSHSLEGLFLVGRLIDQIILLKITKVHPELLLNKNFNLIKENAFITSLEKMALENNFNLDVITLLATKKIMLSRNSLLQPNFTKILTQIYQQARISYSTIQ